MDVGLIKRNNGKYFLTLLGKVVYDTQMIIGKALTYYWKLKAIESVEMSSNIEIPKEELTQLINTLIDNHFIKDILLKLPLSNTLEEPQRYQHQGLKEAKLLLTNLKSSETFNESLFESDILLCNYTRIQCHHFCFLVSSYFINKDHSVDINVRYYQRFHLWFLPVAVMLDIILPATTEHKQQLGTFTNFDQ